MQTNYKIVTMRVMQEYISDGKLRLYKTRTLSDGSKANFYTPSLGYHGSEFIEIECTVYVFKSFSDAAGWFLELTVVPEPPKRTIKIDFDILSRPISLDYNPLTYEYFTKCRLRQLDVVLSETILKDGRVSVLYADIPPRAFDTTNYYHVDYNLVIGRLVFAHWNPEPLIMLEALINSGYLPAWRPELTGTLNYVPGYKLSVFNKYHGKFLKEMRIVKSFVTPTGALAEVYAKKDNTRNCRIMAGELIYSFKTVADCEIIIDALIANDIKVQPDFKPESIRKTLEVVGARLNRFINADMNWMKSDVSVSASGSFVGLNAAS